MALWERALGQDDVVDRLGQTIEVRLYLAAARLTQGQASEAAAVLTPVFARVDAGAGVGGVLLAPQPLAVLARTRWGALLDASQVSSLQTWLNLAQAASACCPEAVVSPNPGGLSQRELEVLSRMAAGDSNKLIARVFDLSPHTVKRHVANILDKLGVQTRGQAAAWYLKHA
jgi:LuxR family maltose regulon positive regulatory protein